MPRFCEYCARVLTQPEFRKARFCNHSCVQAWMNKRRMQPVEARFWSYVNKTDTCWLWTGPNRPNKYGRLEIAGKNVSAHRLSWTLHYGEIPDGLQVLHKCDTPPCVNPDHLFLGTQLDNMRDRHAKGRYRINPIEETECPSSM